MGEALKADASPPADLKRLAQHRELRLDGDGAGAGGFMGRALIEQAVEMKDSGLKPQGLLAKVL